MSDKTKRIIITGAPGSGKTSIIDALNQQNIQTFPEVARTIIHRELQKKSDIVPWLNLEEFSKVVCQQQIEDFIAGTGTAYYDRGLPDVYAYLLKGNKPIPQYLKLAIDNHRYETQVYITPPWKAIYHQDEERTETFEEACEIDHFLKKTYNLLGYELIKIPQDSLENRVSFVLNE